MKDEEFDPILKGSLKILQTPKDEGVQNSSMRTIGAILSRLNNPMDEHADIVHKFLYHARYVFIDCYSVVY